MKKSLIALMVFGFVMIFSHMPAFSACPCNGQWINTGYALPVTTYTLTRPACCNTCAPIMKTVILPASPACSVCKPCAAPCPACPVCKPICPTCDPCVKCCPACPVCNPCDPCNSGGFVKY